MKNIVPSVEIAIKPVIEEMGYVLVEVEYKKKYDSMNLIVYIDHDGGITLDDCEKVHRSIDSILDELDPTDGKPYNLSVSSPGIDRPLKSERDFIKNLNKQIEISLYVPLDGKKKYQGELLSWTNDTVTININGQSMDIETKDITIIRPII